MTRETILRNRLEMASHNLFCLSANYLCTTPKEGMERDHAEAAAEVEMLKTWLKEFHNSCSDSKREFIGYIDAIKCGSTYDNKPCVDYLTFEVETGERFRGDCRIFQVGQEVRSWFIGEDGRCGNYDIEKDKRDSRLLKITVDCIEYVRSIEWVVAEETE